MGRAKDHLARTFEHQLRAVGLPDPVREHRFHGTRKWRFDYAWPEQLLAVEIEGGVWAKTPGRHTRGSGFCNDCEKYNHAALLGWRVLRGEAKMVESGDLLKFVELALK